MNWWPESRCLGRAVLRAFAMATAVSLTAAPAAAEFYSNREWGFAIELPADCHVTPTHDGVAGVCAREGGTAASRSAIAALSLVLEVAALSVPEEKGRTVAELQSGYPQALFEQELPGGVCGDEAGRQLKVSGFRPDQSVGGVVASSGFAAEVVCPPIEILSVPERHARVRYLVTANGVRYRLMALAPAEQLAAARPKVDAFLASFRMLAGRE